MDLEHPLNGNDGAGGNYGIRCQSTHQVPPQTPQQDPKLPPQQNAMFTSPGYLFNGHQNPSHQRTRGFAHQNRVTHRPTVAFCPMPADQTPQVYQAQLTNSQAAAAIMNYQQQLHGSSGAPRHQNQQTVNTTSHGAAGGHTFFHFIPPGFMQYYYPSNHQIRGLPFQTNPGPNMNVAPTQQMPPPTQMMQSTGSLPQNLSSGRDLLPTREKKILKIINPETGKDIMPEIMDKSSGDSSASHTPQPTVGQNPGGSEIAANFAAQVAAAATDQDDLPNHQAMVGPPLRSKITKIGGGGMSPEQEELLMSPLAPLNKVLKTELDSAEHNPALPMMSLGAVVNGPSIDMSKVAHIDQTPFNITSSIKDSHQTPVVSANSVSPTVEVNRSRNTSSPARGVKQVVPASEPHPPHDQSTPPLLPPLSSHKLQPCPPPKAQLPPNPYMEEHKYSLPSNHPSTTSVSRTGLPRSPVSSLPLRGPAPSVAAVTTPDTSLPAPFPSATPAATPPPKSLPLLQEGKRRDKKSHDSRGKREASSGGYQPTTPSASVSTVSQPPSLPSEEKSSSGQQPNGDLPCEPPSEPTGGKASQRQKHNKRATKKELNKKGEQKEGTDMDAFPTDPVSSVVPPSSGGDVIDYGLAVSPSPLGRVRVEPPSPSAITPLPFPPKEESGPEEAVPSPPVTKGPSPPPTHSTSKPEVIPTPPPSPPPPSAPPQVEPSTATPPSSEVLCPTDEVDDESDSIVAANNEENSKPPSLSSSDNIETTVIEKSNKPPLKYNYEEGQWSPLNMEGKKVYGRDFLLELRTDPQSSKKPNHIEVTDVMKDKDSSSNSNNRRPVHGGYGSSSQRGSNNIVPDFIKNSSSSLGQRGYPFQPTKRNPQHSRSTIERGRDSRRGLSSFSQSDRKPKHLEKSKNMTEEESKTDKLKRKVRGILNKLTPQNFDILVEQMLSLAIDTIERMEIFVDLVFEKAVDEPSFSKEYARLCHKIFKRVVIFESATPADSGTPVPEGTSTAPGATPPSIPATAIPATSAPDKNPAKFGKLLLSKCQAEFERKENPKQAEVDKLAEQLKNTKEPEKAKEIQLQLDEIERRVRMRSVGLIRFIGELFKLNLLTPKIMHQCICKLLKEMEIIGVEESLECLCKLLTTIGAELESFTAKPAKEKDPFADAFESYFAQMSELSKKKEGSKVSSRVRFMLQDVIELRANRWKPRRAETTPKTIEQIQRDAEREMIEKDIALANAGPMRNKHESRGDERRRNQRYNSTEDGWNTVNKYGTKSNYALDAKKLNNFKFDEQPPSFLGKPEIFSTWGGGVKSSKNNAPKSLAESSNKFMALNQEKSTSRFDGGRMGPGLSEKERTLQSLKDMMTGDINKRGGSNSGPPSRESSRPRYTQSQGSESGSAPSMSQPIATSESTSTAAITLLPEELISSKSRTILNEWMQNNQIEESVKTIQEEFPGENLVASVRASFQFTLEKPLSTRKAYGHLLSELLKRKIVSEEAVIQEFELIFEVGDDLVIDLPHIWKYVADLYVSLMIHGVFNFSQLKAANKSTYVSSVLDEVIKLLITEKGPEWIRAVWSSSNVQMQDFVEPSEVDKFIEQHKFEFLFGQGNVIPKVETSLTLTEIEQKLLSHLKQEVDKGFDYTCDWIKTNVPPEVTQSPEFIRALTFALLKACIDKDQLDERKFSKHRKLITRFVDNKKELEIAVLYATQNLVVNAMYGPPGLLLKIFQNLHDNSIISSEAFITWYEPGRSETPYETEGKGVAATSTRNFLIHLMQDLDEEESPDT